MQKRELSSVFNALISGMPNLNDGLEGGLIGGFAVLSDDQMLKLKGGAYNNNGNCGNCGNCGGCPPDNNGNCGNCGNCEVEVPTNPPVTTG